MRKWTRKVWTRLDADVKEAFEMKGKLLNGNEAGLHLLGTSHPLILLTFRDTVRKWCVRDAENGARVEVR